MLSIRLSLLFLWAIGDLVTCENEEWPKVSMPVALGESLTLNCTFSCPAGFVRGCWRKESNSDCLGTNSKSGNCTVSLHLASLTAKDLGRKYICYTLHTDDPKLLENIKRVVWLYLQDFPAQTIAPDWTVTPRTTAKNVSLPAEAKDSTRGDLTGFKVLAMVTITVAMVLAALAVYLCVDRNRQSRNGKGEPVPPISGWPSPPHGVLAPSQGSSSTHCERVIVRIPTPDNESDTEVPYADIMITVRGVSTPELSQVCYLTPGDQKECWLDESRCLLQASRSADRLHVHQPREVSRKMSTNSEYAVITYA